MNFLNNKEKISGNKKDIVSKIENNKNKFSKQNKKKNMLRHNYLKKTFKKYFQIK